MKSDVRSVTPIKGVLAPFHGSAPPPGEGDGEGDEVVQNPQRSELPEHVVQQSVLAPSQP